MRRLLMTIFVVAFFVRAASAGAPTPSNEPLVRDEAQGYSFTPNTYCHIQDAPAGGKERVCREAQPNIARYAAEIDSAQRNYTLALFATTCGLRSQQWLAVFRDTYETFAIEEANRLGIPTEQAIAIQSGSEPAMAEIRKTVTCQSLLNGPTMNRLDEIERQATGDYR